MREDELPDAHLPADLGVRPLPPLVLQAGHVGEVLPLDEHVARADRLLEVDDGASSVVFSVVADLARSRSISPRRSGRRSTATSAGRAWRHGFDSGMTATRA